MAIMACPVRTRLCASATGDGCETGVTPSPPNAGPRFADRQWPRSKRMGSALIGLSHRKFNREPHQHVGRHGGEIESWRKTPIVAAAIGSSECGRDSAMHFRLWPTSDDLRGAPKSSVIRGTADVSGERPAQPMLTVSGRGYAFENEIGDRVARTQASL
jgi:hypothetical protein